MKRGYRHGGLRRALVDTAIELIERDGVSSFSVAEACRQLNVSPAAPYRHFTDRNDLLTAVAIRGAAVLADHVTVSSELCPDPLDRLARSVSGYAVFAARHPALFEVVFSKEVAVGTNSELVDAVRPIVEAFITPTYQLPGIADQDASGIVVAAAAIAHGYGAFLGVGSFGAARDAVAAASGRASAAVRALVIGCAAFLGEPEEPPIMLAGTSFQKWVSIITAAKTLDRPE